MRVLLDENLPRPLIKQLRNHEYSTAQIQGWKAVENGELLGLIEQYKWDVFLTGDKNLRYQQNLSSRQVAIIELPTNRWPILRRMIEPIQKAIDSALPGAYIIV